jgi:hypothetical protein
VAPRSYLRRSNASPRVGSGPNSSGAFVPEQHFSARQVAGAGAGSAPARLAYGWSDCLRSLLAHDVIAHTCDWAIVVSHRWAIGRSRRIAHYCRGDTTIRGAMARSLRFRRSLLPVETDWDITHKGERLTKCVSASCSRSPSWRSRSSRRASGEAVGNPAASTAKLWICSAQAAKPTVRSS